MEYMVECYLEQFTTQPRNSLHDRRKRRACVSYITTLIEGHSKGQNCKVEESAHDAIVALIRYHAKNRALNSSICLMGRFHNVLYVAIRLAYNYQLPNTETITALLEAIFACEQTFERIYIGAIFGHKAPHYIAGWKSDFDSQEQNLHALVYFLHHANNARLEWSTTRFIDVPIESCGRASPLRICVQLGLPDKILVLLRFGAQLNDGEHLFRGLLNKLLKFRHYYPYNLVACLVLLLRTVPRLPLSCGEIADHFEDLVNDGIVPTTRLCNQVVELKHLARCAVRRRLWRNWQLPGGIKKLGVPQKLENYIDLLED